MIYIYTKDFCSACVDLKEKYRKEGVDFVERDGNRLIAPAGDRDSIDLDALTVLAMQNMTFPIEVESNEL